MKERTGTRINTVARITDGSWESPPILCDLRFHDYDQTVLDCELVLIRSDDENLTIKEYLKANALRDLVLKTEESLNPITISHITNQQFDGIKYVLTGHKVTLGFSDLPLLADSQYILMVKLSPGGILNRVGSRMFKMDGQIEVTLFTQDHVEVTTPIGVFRCQDQYNNFETTEYGVRSTHLLCNSSIHARITVMKGVSLLAQLKIIEEYLHNICILLSFCFRQHVRYWDLQLIADPEIDNGHHAAHCRYKEDTNRNRHDIENLIDIRNMVGGQFQTLYDNFMSADNRKTLQDILTFLVSTYEPTYIEAKYFLCFSAFETSINYLRSSLALHDSFGNSEWKRLETHLRSSVRAYCEENGLDVQCEHILSKLPELKRPTSFQRMISTIEQGRITIDDLWRKEPFDDALNRCIRNRNLLFHATSVRDYGQMAGDLVRLQVLTERICLRIVGWSEDRLCRWNTQRLDWMNS